MLKKIISADEKNIHRLKDNISRLKLQVSELKAAAKKRDRSEREHTSSQNKFKTVFEQSSLGHKFIDADLKIIKVNKALIKLLGYSRKELLGTCIIDIAVPEFVEHWKELQHELWEKRKPSFSFDTCIIKKNKSVIWCHITSILLEADGNTLGYTILEDVTERKMLENDLKDATHRERLFGEQLLETTINTQEKERSRIAEDLHNSLGQLLYAVRLNLDHVKLGKEDQHKQNALNIKTTKDLLVACIKECRRISHDLMPAVLEDFGLKEAVQDICNQLGRTITFKCEFKGLENRLPKYLEIAIYRIIQELATNLVKHADATKASLKLGISEKSISVRVEDNGKGFNTSNIKEDDGIGIQSIKTKLHLLKGELEIDSTPGKGTIVSIRLPSKVSELN
ncbi:MAG: PAS domain-containing sensor histidine kinase [Pedobacter sp.]